MTEVLRGRGRTRRLCIGMSTHITLSRLKFAEKTWPEMVTILKKVKRSAESSEEYFRADKDTKHKIKDLGNFVLGKFVDDHRLASKCVFRDAITLDMDDLPVAFDWKTEVQNALEGYAFLAYTTFSHTENAPKIRILIPTDRAMSPEEYEPVARLVAEKIRIDSTDPISFVVAQAMFWPGCPKDGSVEFLESPEGSEFIPVEDLLDEYLDWKDQSEWPFGAHENRRGVNNLGKKAQDPREKNGVIGAFCRIYGIRAAVENWLSDVYLPGDSESRYTYASGSTSNGAVIYGEDDQDDLFLYSNHSTDPCGQQLVNAWDLVRIHLFGHLDSGTAESIPVNRRPSTKEMIQFAKDLDEVTVEWAKSRRPVVGFDDITEELDQIEPESSEKAEDKPDLPVDRAYFDLGPNPLGLYDDAPDMMMDTRPRVADPSKSGDSPEWLGDVTSLLSMTGGQDPAFNARSLDNLVKILSRDRYLAGAIRYNQFSSTKVITKNILGIEIENPIFGKPIEDVFYLQVKLYIERVYGMMPSTTLVQEAIHVVALNRPFNPVKDALNSEKYPWDGVCRIDEWLIEYLGAEDNELNRAIGRKFWIQLVQRALNPGHKCDHMIVLEGPQGIGKSTILRTVAMGFFTDALGLGMEDKEIIEVTRAALIAEIAEMSVRRKSVIEHTKHLITRQTDRARLAYAREAQDFPRTFVLAGTTNDTDYLEDHSGNRRFWPVWTTKADVSRIKPVVWQMYREAQAYVEAGEVNYLSEPGLIADLTARQRRSTFDSGNTAAIIEWLNTPIDENYWDRPVGSMEDLNAKKVMRDKVHPKEIWVQALGESPNRYNKAAARLVTLEMSRVPGWVKSEKCMRFGRRFEYGRGYVRGDQWLNL